jgi:ParB/RepB/Spo0J family partition protein
MAALVIERANAAIFPASVKNLQPKSALRGLLAYSAVADAEAYRRSLNARGQPATMHLDASLVCVDEWAVRHESSYAEPSFLELMRSIQKSGGNDTPILVRPMRCQVVGSSNFNQVIKYAVVIGERRHRACVVTNTPLHVLVEEIDDRDQYKRKLLDNAHQKPICPYEAGVSYVLALQDNGDGKGPLFSSQSDLASHLGIHRSMICDGRKLGLLPKSVVEAFSDVKSIQYNFAKELNDALETDRDAVVNRAEEIRSSAEFDVLPARKVCDLLTGKKVKAKPVPWIRICIEGRQVMSVDVDNQGHQNVHLAAFTEGERNALEHVRLLLLQLTDPRPQEVAGTASSQVSRKAAV